MSKFIETNSRKIVSAFAGVGALVEDIKGVVKVQPIDKWIFFTTNKHLKEEYHINDHRLLQRLKDDKGFPKLKYLIKTPTNTTNNYSDQQYIQPTDWEMVATAQYFPKWMFCSKCNRFKSLKDWWQKWDKVIKQYDANNSNKAKDFFTPPKCGYCHEEAKKNKKNGWYGHELTQVRFIMVSSDGKISDIPWDKWLTFKQQAQHEEDKTIDFSKWKPCCNNQDLYYKLGYFEDLAGINISCKGCEKFSTLTGLYSLSYFSDTEKHHRYKMVVRASNSVYYPILVHSLYLPNQSGIDDIDQAKIDRWLDKNKDVNFMFDALDERYQKTEIQNYIDTQDNQGFQKELIYRQKEYKFILENKDYDREDFTFKHQEYDLKQYNISHLVKISRLKMTTVQTGYTRQQPLDIDLFLDNETYTIKPKYTSTKGNQTEYLLGIENFGEGIFIAFNENIAQNYLKNNKSKIQTVFDKSKESALFKNHFKNIEHLAKFMAVHTLSHLLMKELEFSCGYPTVSLSERLFVDDKEMNGVLIYTVGGMEGSYGGLVSQAQPDKFKQLLDNALERAKNCASDPICYHSDGQGVAEMNLAACYSCALVAENACESFNSFLDRQAIKQ